MILKRTKNKLQIGNLIMTASRWPWQGYGWRATGGPTAPLNTSGARFGGGWRFKLGISVGSTTVLTDLLFGIVTFRWESAAERARIAQQEVERVERNRRLDAFLASLDHPPAHQEPPRQPTPKPEPARNAQGFDIPF